MNAILSGYSLLKKGKKLYKGLNALKKYKDLNNSIYMDPCFFIGKKRKERYDIGATTGNVTISLTITLPNRHEG